MTTTMAPHETVQERAEVAASPGKEIVRDIARGGLTGILVGIVVVGLGGRLVMRLATLLQTQAIGGFTDNGNRIGDITLGGTFTLVIVGMFIGAVAGTVWVVVTPWLPAGGWRRAIMAMPLAIAIGTVGLIEGNTGDFIKLRHDPIIVALLIVLVGFVGLGFSLIDDLLERRLPHPAGHPGATGFYTIIVLIGSVLSFPFALLTYFGSSRAGGFLIGVALVVTGLATATWWLMRLEGRTIRPRALTIIGRTALVAAAVAGIAAAVPGVSGALGR